MILIVNAFTTGIVIVLYPTIRTFGPINLQMLMQVGSYQLTLCCRDTGT